MKSEFRKRLEAGEIVLGMNARHSRTTEIGALLKDCGFHWLMLDDEHTPLNPAAVYETFLGANRIGMTTFMRVRRNDPTEIGLQMSNCPTGVFVPHVDTAEQAKSAAAASRYAPRGHLSVPGFFPQVGYRPMPFPQATEILNAQTVVVCMIESAEAVENAEAIAAVDGVDVLFIGASDLTYEMGIGSQYGDDRVRRAVKRVCDAARKHGKFAGMGGVKGDDLWKEYIGYGMQMIMTESDLAMLVTRAIERVGYFETLAKAAR